MSENAAWVIIIAIVVGGCVANNYVRRPPEITLMCVKGPDESYECKATTP